MKANLLFGGGWLLLRTHQPPQGGQQPRVCYKSFSLYNTLGALACLPISSIPHRLNRCQVYALADIYYSCSSIPSTPANINILCPANTPPIPHQYNAYPALGSLSGSSEYISNHMRKCPV